VQLDDTNAPALRELVRIYEALGRFRDLLTCQQRLAELTEDATERGELYRAVARRWAEQFSNVQNAIAGYEGLLAAMPQDEEARAKLRELYTKRRAWGPALRPLRDRGDRPPKGRTRSRCSARWRSFASERLDRGADAILLQKKILDSRSVGGRRLRRAREAGRTPRRTTRRSPRSSSGAPA
jgi:tetratricopeptide (TPR) repeat protein